MNKIAALVDFTPTTDVVLAFAKGLATFKKAPIVLIHISDSSDNEVATQKLKVIVDQVNSEGLQAEAVVQTGSFFNIIRQVLVREHASIAVIGTHGKKGFKQNLFGSNILKLVKLIGRPALVVQENSVYQEKGFESVLLPVGSHPSYEMIWKQTHSVLNLGAKTTSYAIYKTDELDPEVQKNLTGTVNYFKEMGMNADIVQEEATRLSIGYSSQTIDFLEKNPYSLISIMSQVATNSLYFGDVDKENILLNPLGIPVLCCDEQ